MPGICIEPKDEKIFNTMGNDAIEISIDKYNGTTVQHEEYRSICFLKHRHGDFLCFAIDLKTSDLLLLSRVKTVTRDDVSIGYGYDIINIELFKECIKKCSARNYERIKDIPHEEREKLKDIVFGRISNGRDILVKQEDGDSVILFSGSDEGDMCLIGYAEVPKEMYGKYFANKRYLGDVYEALANEDSDFRKELGDGYISTRIKRSKLKKFVPKKEVAVLNIPVSKYMRYGFIHEKETETKLPEHWHNLACYMRYLKKKPAAERVDKTVYVYSYFDYIKQIAGSLKEFFKNLGKNKDDKFQPDYISPSMIEKTVPVKSDFWYDRYL